MKAAKRKRKQKPKLVVVKARRAGAISQGEPAHPLALGRELNDVGDERS